MFKLDNFFSNLTFVAASSWSKYCICWSSGGKGPRSPHPEKTQVIWVSIGNKQLDSPPLRKSWTPPLEKKCWSPSGTLENYNFLWNKTLAFCKISQWLKINTVRDFYDRWTWTPPPPPWGKFLDWRMVWYKYWAIVPSPMLECHIIIAGDFSWKG